MATRREEHESESIRRREGDESPESLEPEYESIRRTGGEQEKRQGEADEPEYESIRRTGGE
jgi:hypothetical protein